MAKQGRDEERRLLLDLPEGFTFQTSNSGHLQILRPDGEPLRMPGGMPIIVARTPSDKRTRLTERSRVRRALRDLE